MRVSTGVAGLDKLLDGGIPEQSVVLLSGSAGVGKTIFSLQFLADGVKRKESCLFLTFEQSERKIYDQASRFGLDFEKN